MLRLKACPRCGGDLAEEALPYEAEWVCLQCAYRVESERNGHLPRLFGFTRSNIRPARGHRRGRSKPATAGTPGKPGYERRVA